MNYYTVLLLRPDYIADPYGTDTFMTIVLAASVREAEQGAQISAYVADDWADEDGRHPEDYVVLAVISGLHEDIKTT